MRTEIEDAAGGAAHRAPGTGTLAGTYTAHPGSLLLSTNGNAIDLGSPSARLQMRVSGVLGARELTFVSGTSLGSMMQAVNSFAGETGVFARHVGYGLELSAPTESLNAFTSITILNDGDVSNMGIRAVRR